jgi:predicted metal-binding protein
MDRRNPRTKVERGVKLYICKSCRNVIAEENREPVDGMQDYEDRIF